MVWGLVAAAAGGLLSSALGSKAQSKAANAASDAQVQAAQLSIDEQRRQFDEISALLKPFVDQGTTALGQQSALLGLSGNEAQQQAVNAIQGGSEYQTLLQQGENALLQNASATGGLRGGNTQNALMQYRPQLLNDLIQQRYSQLGGLSSAGQNAAAQQGSFGAQASSNISNQLTQMGQAQAGNALAQGQAKQQMYGGIASALGQFTGGLF
jgi:hypothetical protein